MKQEYFFLSLSEKYGFSGIADLREDRQFLMDYPGACTISTQQVDFPLQLPFAFPQTCFCKSCGKIIGPCYCCLDINKADKQKKKKKWLWLTNQ